MRGFSLVAIAALWSAGAWSAPPVPQPVDANVVNTPDVNVANTPSVNVPNPVDVNVLSIPEPRANPIEYESYYLNPVMASTGDLINVPQVVNATLFKVEIEKSSEEPELNCVVSMTWSAELPTGPQNRGVRVFRETVDITGPGNASASIILPRPLAVKVGQYINLHTASPCNPRLYLLHYEKN